MKTRKQRAIKLTEHIRVLFENRQTIQYQIQEELYAARSSCPEMIHSHLSTYRHLLPTEQSLKATLMFEYPDASEAETQLNHLKGAESTIYLQVEGHEKIWPTTNDDLGGIVIISAVHYLNFVFATEMISALRKGAAISIGMAFSSQIIGPKTIETKTRKALLSDLNGGSTKDVINLN